MDFLKVDPVYRAQLDWADHFVRHKVEPLEALFPNPFDRSEQRAMAVARPLMDEVRARGLWACHLSPDLGGGGYGQFKLALLNEILGRSIWAPTIFGCQAPDSGNAEILAAFGTPEQKARYLEPLLAGDVVSGFAMTEPQGGADPRVFTTRAVRDGDDWVIDGEKWFITSAGLADFLIVMAITDTEVPVHRGASMLIVPTATPGLEIVRDVSVFGEHPSANKHAYLRFDGVRVPTSALLGVEGAGFAITQARLGGGRIHHAMRTLGAARRAFEALCERAVSRRVRGGALGELGLTRHVIARSWIEIEQFRLLVMRTAWLIDHHQDYAAVRADIAAVKAAMPEVLRNVVQRALHLHGALGVSDEMPFGRMLIEAEWLALADGPTEVHENVLAKAILSTTPEAPDAFPSDHLPRMRATAAALGEHDA